MPKKGTPLIEWHRVRHDGTVGHLIARPARSTRVLFLTPEQRFKRFKIRLLRRSIVRGSKRHDGAKILPTPWKLIFGTRAVNKRENPDLATLDRRIRALGWLPGPPPRSLIAEIPAQPDPLDAITLDT